MGYFILGLLAAICAAGWLLQRISTMSLLWYLQEKNCPFPSSEEMKKGSRYVAEHMFRDVFGGKR